MIKKTLFILVTSVTMAASAAIAGDVDYTSGVFIVNEDWYGHQNSTVNYLVPDDPDGNYWHYRVIQAENPGKELGCTAQFGAIWDGKFYLISKQDKDPGASVTGGRITVADAKTMKILYQSSTIDPSGQQCDGRGFLGIDKNKGYISSSNGVWIFDLNTFKITGQVEGSANPNEAGSLYNGQSGSMVQAAGRVFVAHQQSGLLVINPDTDKVTDVISLDIVQEGAGIGSVVLAKDGSLWLSVAKSTQGSGDALPYLVKVDPATLSTKVIDIPSGMYPPTNSWYAWTPDAFCASSKTNTLFWKGGMSSWFSGAQIYSYDINSDTVKLIIDLDADDENWKVYGCSMRVHPETDEIYASLYHDFGSNTYITRRYTAEGKKIKDYPMIANYWFPSIPVFPQSGNDQSGMTGIEATDCGSVILMDKTLLISGLDGKHLMIYTLSGSLAECVRITANDFSHVLTLPHGMYIVKAGDRTLKIVL